MDRQTQSLAEIAGGTAFAGAGAAGAAYGARRAVGRISAERDEAIGTTGALDGRGRPTPIQVTSRRKHAGKPSQRERAIGRFEEAAKPYAARMKSAKGKAGALAAPAILAGGALAVHGAMSKGFEVTPVRLGSYRRPPANPLSMNASASIMSDFMAAALGRNLSRRQRKAMHRMANEAVGASGMSIIPLTYGQAVTGS